MVAMSTECKGFIRVASGLKATRTTSGAPEVIPPSVPPVTTASIGQTCGNNGGFQPFTAAERQTRGLTDEAAYIARYRAALTRLETEGFLLPEDLAPIAEAARAQFNAP